MSRLLHGKKKEQGKSCTDDEEESLLTDSHEESVQKHHTGRWKLYLTVLLCLVLVCIATVAVLFEIGKVRYRKKYEPVSISFEYDCEPADHLKLSLQKDNESELTAVLLPDTAEGKVQWESSDSDVLITSELDDHTCVLGLLDVGTVEITASCGDAVSSLTVTVESDIIEFLNNYGQ